MRCSLGSSSEQLLRVAKRKHSDVTPVPACQHGGQEVCLESAWIPLTFGAGCCTVQLVLYSFGHSYSAAKPGFLLPLCSKTKSSKERCADLPVSHTKLRTAFRFSY